MNRYAGVFTALMTAAVFFGPQPAASQDNDFTVKWKPAPEISSADGDFKFKIRGRLLVDADWINDKDDTVDASLTEFRAARIGVEGVIFKNTKYKFEVDFAGNEVDIKDALIEQVFPRFSIKLGQFKTPNSLEEQTSSRYITFMERGGMTDAFGLARRLGIGVGTGGDKWTLSAGVFRGAADDDDADEETSVAGRVTFSPLRGVHVGGSVRYRDQGESSFRYRQRPHNHGSPVRFIETGRLFEEDFLAGLEGAVVYGPVSVQGEWAWQFAEFDPMLAAGRDDPTFTAGYIDVSYFITGERRNYSASKGSFSGVKVRHPVHHKGPGAVQIAGRIDWVDLSDNGVFGGEQLTFIAGVNWHLNDYMRVMANYSHSDIDNATGPRVIADNGDDGENSVDTFGFRFQVHW